MQATPYDVAIIGSGLGGATLAAILARQGLRVLVLERSEHPRFALGEAVVPEFSFRAKLLAEIYDVEELALMGNFRSMARRVSSRTGIKRNFTFLHHQSDRPHRDEDTCQFEAMTPPLGPDAHIYRADMDDWLKSVAIQRGAEYLEGTRVERVEFGEESVSLHTTRGRFEAGFVVDGAGRNGPLASKRAKTELSLETDTRSIFTHMVGVEPLARVRPRLAVPSPPDQGTLHHMFDGGWFWIIPFGNHANSTSRLTSVGLTLERKRFPVCLSTPEAEFRSFADRLPTVADQLRSARAVRSWVRTSRLQFESSAVHGDRWCLLPGTAGFVDPLFSGGLATTLSGVHEIAEALLGPLEQRESSLEHYAKTTSTNQAYLDQVVHGAYISFRSSALFDAWYRFWAVANYHASLGLVRIWLKHRSGDENALRQLNFDAYRYVLALGQPRVRALVEAGYAIVRRFESDEASESETCEALFALLEEQTWIPKPFHIASRHRRHLASFSFVPMVSMILWGKRHTPRDIRTTYYDVPARYFSEVAGFLGGELQRGIDGAARGLRDAFWVRSRTSV